MFAVIYIYIIPKLIWIKSNWNGIESRGSVRKIGWKTERCTRSLHNISIIRDSLKELSHIYCTQSDASSLLSGRSVLLWITSTILLVFFHLLSVLFSKLPQLLSAEHTSINALPLWVKHIIGCSRQGIILGETALGFCFVNTAQFKKHAGIVVVLFCCMFWPCFHFLFITV